MNRHLHPTHWVSATVFLLTGYVLIFVQARLSVIRDTLGAQPDFLPGLMVYAGLAFRLETVAGCAALLGLLFDSLSANPPGTTIITLSVIGLLAARFREVLLSEQFVTHWFLGVAASAVAPLISIVVCSFGGASPLAGWSSVWPWLLMTAGGGLATPLWFVIFNRLDDALRYKEVPDAPYRADRQIARGKY